MVAQTVSDAAATACVPITALSKLIHPQYRRKGRWKPRQQAADDGVLHRQTGDGGRLERCISRIFRLNPPRGQRAVDFTDAQPPVARRTRPRRHVVEVGLGDVAFPTAFTLKEHQRR